MTQNEAARLRRNTLARQALRTQREQRERTRRDMETARTTGNDMEANAHAKVLEAFHVIIFDLEAELGPAMYEKDEAIAAEAGGNR
jgi:hypothetical protein